MPLIPIMPLIFFMVMSILYVNIFMDSKKDFIINKRKKQSDNFINNSFRNKFKEETTKRVSFNKREQIEILCLNAGFDVSYSDYLLLCFFSAVFCFLFISIIIKNIYLGLVISIIIFNTPKQILIIIKRKRLDKLELQIGPFMKMVIKRYETSRDFEKAMIATTKEFFGTEPLFTELSKTVSEMNLMSINEALDNLAKRTSNKYLGLLADYYRISSALGTNEVRKKLLNQAYIQYDENRKLKSFLKEQISEPIRDSYFILATVPIFFLFGCFYINGYTNFMFNTTLGKITMTVLFVIMLGAVWFVNKVIGAPLDKSGNRNNNPSQRK